MAKSQFQAMFADSECATSSKQTAMSSTFVTTDRDNFKETVQRLTGLSEGENLPLTIPARNSNRGREIPEIKSDGICCGGLENMVELGPHKSHGNCFGGMKNMIELGSQKSDGSSCGGMKNMIELGPQKSDGNRCGGLKKMVELGPQKSDGNRCALMKNMIELGPQKRRKVDRKLEIKLGNAMKLGGHKSMLMPSPISPLGADLFSSYSYSPSYSSTPTSCNQSSFLEEEVEEFCFRALPNQKTEPKLLTLFPLSSSTQPTKP